MQRLKNWAVQRESKLAEIDSVATQAERMGKDSQNFEWLAGISVLIVDLMFSFACAAVNNVMGDEAAVSEDVRYTKESHAVLLAASDCLPERYQLLKDRIRDTYLLPNRVGIPQLYEMVAEVEDFADIEKRLLLAL